MKLQLRTVFSDILSKNSQHAEMLQINKINMTTKVIEPNYAAH
jgi:hypothetical protein